MRTDTSARRYLCTLILILPMLFASCEKALIPDEEDVNTQETNNGSKHEVTILTRAATATNITTPVYLTVTDATGKTVATQTIASADEKLKVKLTDGKYHIHATTGSDMAAGYSSTPLMVGNADFTVEGKTVSVNILMAYAVASISIRMTNVPADATAVKVSLAPIYSTATTDGYEGSTTATIPCRAENSTTWTTGTTYVLPSASQTTTISISVTMPSGTETYSVIYPAALRAAVPYSI